MLLLLLGERGAGFRVDSHTQRGVLCKPTGHHISWVFMASGLGLDALGS